MKIQFRWWDGKGFSEDLKVGTPGVTSTGVVDLFHGKRIVATSGIGPDLHRWGFTVEGGASLWFDTFNSGTPRVLIERK